MRAYHMISPRGKEDICDCKIDIMIRVFLSMSLYANSKILKCKKSHWYLYSPIPQPPTPFTKRFISNCMPVIQKGPHGNRSWRCANDIIIICHGVGIRCGATILVSPTLVKSLQLVWKLYIRRFHLLVHDLQMGCTDLTKNKVQDNSSSNGLQGDMPHQHEILILMPATFSAWSDIW